MVEITDSNENINNIKNFITNNDTSSLTKYLKGNHINYYFFNKNKNIIKDLIKSQNNKILKTIFNTYKFNNDFILNLLILFKNKKLTYSKLTYLITEENNKIIITNDMYDIALKNNNYIALKILFENEIITKKYNALKRIIKYNLFENSIKSKDINFVKKILTYKNFDFKNLRYEEILTNVFKNNESFNSTSNDDNIARLLINSILKPPYSTYIYKNVILNIAIKTGNFDIVKYLIENENFKYTSKDINSKDLKGEYPIIVAILNKNIEIFDYLLEKGADRSIKSNNGVPLLFLAIYLNDIDFVISLINNDTRYKININIRDNNGYTPLIASYTNKYMDIFNYLIDFSDINLKDKYGNSILYYVIQNKDNAMAQNLINIGAKIDGDIIDIAIEKGCLKCILNNDVIPLNYINGKGEPLLISAILNSHTYDSDIEKLIKKGCNVNDQDMDGNTPLIYATIKEKIYIAELLIKYGANKSRAIEYVPCCNYKCNRTNECLHKRLKNLLY